MKGQTRNLKKIDQQKPFYLMIPDFWRSLPEPDSEFIPSVLDIVESLIIILDQTHQIIHFNKAFRELTGFSFDEIKGKSIWEIFIPELDYKTVQKFIEKQSEDQLPFRHENSIITKDGRIRIISCSFYAILDDNGIPKIIICAGQDITESKQEAILLDARQSLQRVSTALLQHNTTLGEMLKLICTEALDLTGAAGSAVLLLEDEKWLRVTMSSGSIKPVFDRMPISKSIAGAVIGQDEPLLMNESEGQVQAYYQNPDLKTLLAVPLKVNGVPFGVMDVVNKLGGFTQDDVQIMVLFADQAAIAIENARLQEHAEQLVILEERQRIARELHDSVTQALYSVNLYADATQLALTAGKQPVANEHLQSLRNMAREAMLDMRLLIFELRPPILEKEGLVAAIQARLEAVEVRSGIRAECSVKGEIFRLPHLIEEEIYRVTQETLTNVVKHAGARQVSVRLQFNPGQLHMEICDDGKGFDLLEARKSGGLGLQSMEERIQRIGGTLTVDTMPGQGTSLSVQIEI